MIYHFILNPKSGRTRKYKNLEDIIKTINIFNKRFMLIVKDAGQGKTNLLCDFTETYLRKLKIR